MTTRRDVVTGLAVTPFAAVPIATTGDAAEVGPSVPVPPTAPCPMRPVFLHEIDRLAYQELELLEQLAARMKARVLQANDPNPLIRYGALFDMRCSLTAAGMTVGGLHSTAETQRIEAHEARLAEEIRREAEGLPHNPDFIARYRTDDAAT